MKHYIEIPVFLTTIILLLIALGTKDKTYLAYGAGTSVLLLLVDTKVADRLGSRFVQIASSLRPKELRSPAAEFFSLISVVLVVIQWDILRKLFFTDQGAIFDTDLTELFVVSGFVVPLMFSLTFLLSKISGLEAFLVPVIQVILRFQFIYLLFVGITISFFTEQRGAIVYTCIASAILTYVVFGLWRVFPPKVERPTS